MDETEAIPPEVHSYLLFPSENFIHTWKKIVHSTTGLIMLLKKMFTGICHLFRFKPLSRFSYFVSEDRSSAKSIILCLKIGFWNTQLGYESKHLEEIFGTTEKSHGLFSIY